MEDTSVGFPGTQDHRRQRRGQPRARSPSSRSTAASATRSATRCRRVLLSSLAGAAVTSIRIEGVAHEFSTIEGVKEDVTDIVLNLKDVVCRMHGETDEIEAPLIVTGPGEVKAKDIDLPVRRRDPQPERAHRDAREEGEARDVPHDRPRPRLPAGRGQQVARAADRRDPDRLDLLAGAPRLLRGRGSARRAADRLRQADARHRDRRLGRPAGGAARGGRGADPEPLDLHRREPDREPEHARATARPSSPRPPRPAPRRTAWRRS